MKDRRDEGRREPGANPEPGLGSAVLVRGAATDGRAALHKRTLAAGSRRYARAHLVRSRAALLLPVS